MHVHELNPWRTLIALSIFVIILVVGFLTIQKPLLSYQLNTEESLNVLNDPDACFYPWQLDGVLKQESKNVLLFDIRDNFEFGQGHIPGAENISANDLTKEENIERLEDLKDGGMTVVLYGEDQLQANAPWLFFRQVGFDNVKVLLGGYQYYLQHQDNLVATKSQNDFKMGIARYDFAKIASQSGGESINPEKTIKTPVIVRRKKKAVVASGGC